MVTSLISTQGLVAHWLRRKVGVWGCIDVLTVWVAGMMVRGTWGAGGVPIGMSSTTCVRYLLLLLDVTDVCVSLKETSLECFL